VHLKFPMSINTQSKYEHKRDKNISEEERQEFQKCAKTIGEILHKDSKNREPKAKNLGRYRNRSARADTEICKSRNRSFLIDLSGDKIRVKKVGIVKC
jgi:hypothetical protein